MENIETCSELTRLLRVQRHDFINHLQVIHAYLQLSKQDRAMQYIEDLCKDPDLLFSSLSGHVSQPDCRRKAGS